MTAAKLSFRKMVPDDADAVARVEAACFPVPWSRESFWREASNENTSYILAIDEGTANFLAEWKVMQYGLAPFVDTSNMCG